MQHHKIRGPDARFTKRINVKIRPDQRESLVQIAGLLGRTESDVVRWILDHGITAINDATREDNP